MPQLRSFTGFASTPGIGAAVIGGAGIAQRANEAAMNAANEQSRISAQIAANNMEHQARMAAIQQDALKQAQELEVQKAYNEARIGLQQKEFELQQQKIGDEISRAAQETSSRLGMERMAISAYEKGKKSPLEAQSIANLYYGPTANQPQVSAAIINENQRRAEAAARIPGNIGDVGPAQGELGKRGYNTFRASENSMQLVPPINQREVEDIEGDPDFYGRGAARYPKEATRKAQLLEKRRDRLEEKLESAEYADRRALMRRSADPDLAKKFSAGEKAALQEYKDKLAMVKDMDDKIEALYASNRAAKTNTPAATAPQTGGVGRFKWTTE